MGYLPEEGEGAKEGGKRWTWVAGANMRPHDSERREEEEEARLGERDQRLDAIDAIFFKKGDSFVLVSLSTLLERERERVEVSSRPQFCHVQTGLDYGLLSSGLLTGRIL